MSLEPSERDLHWPGCWNVRDLGGLRAEGAAISRGAVVRSDDPGFLDPEGWSMLAAHGVRTLLDLRYPGEGNDLRPAVPAAASPERAAVQIARVELLGRPDDPAMTEIYAGRDPDTAYRLAFDRRAPQIAEALGALAGAQPGGVLVHCTAGRDRTGIVVALLLALCGVDRQAIAEDYALSEPRIRSGLESMPPSDGVTEALRRNRAGTGTVLGLFAYLDERYGGPESYLLAGGLAEQDITALRARLLAP